MCVNLNYLTDTDECVYSNMHNCNGAYQRCVNRVGDYVCECVAGYAPSGPDESCEGKSNWFSMMISTAYMHCILGKRLVCTSVSTPSIHHKLAIH